MTDAERDEIVFERPVLMGSARVRVIRVNGRWRVDYLADWSPGNAEVQAEFDTVEAAIADCNERAAKIDVMWSSYLGNVLEGNP